MHNRFNSCRVYIYLDSLYCALNGKYEHLFWRFPSLNPIYISKKIKGIIHWCTLNNVLLSSVLNHWYMFLLGILLCHTPTHIIISVSHLVGVCWVTMIMVITMIKIIRLCSQWSSWKQKKFTNNIQAFYRKPSIAVAGQQWWVLEGKPGKVAFPVT